MEFLIIIITGILAGLLSGAVGFGGGMIIMPVITFFYGVEIAVPTATIAQLMSNLSKAGMGLKDIKWQATGRFLILAAPLTALGAFEFAVVPKQLLTRIVCVFLIMFAILKITGRMRLPKKQGTIIIGGGITGLINGMLGISGPLSSAVFLTLELSPIAYIASEAAAASMMHIIKIIIYHKLDYVNLHLLLNGLYIGFAMILGNFIAMHFIKKINKKRYQKVVAGIMILVSIWLIISV
ncbi:MAG: sulfite exporter TauE/SafE family protein [Bacteroides sp.]|jgi:uncharacterized membrane protein YfcA|nr:sulfite exporter TauE/SafE family protein [Bacteroides sp.]MCI1681957.1 sulfite exporter TauE/SafE family protein [Bacteroides sp.]